MATTFVGLFAGIPLLIWFTSITIVNVGTLLLLIFFCGAIGLLQWRYIRDHIDLAYHQYAMYAFSGFAMCLLNFLLFINLEVRVGGHTETHIVSEYIFTDGNGQFATSANDPALARTLKNFIESRYDVMPETQKITVVYAKGLLGFDMITDVTFTD